MFDLEARRSSRITSSAAEPTLASLVWIYFISVFMSLHENKSHRFLA